MAADTIQFVDSIASSPTVRLNINDETTWNCEDFQAPPPRLRRNVGSNTLLPGGTVATAVHDLRTLTLHLDLITASQDTNATAIQNLARELDRDTNILKYQPVGATKPVFFKTFRSDVSELSDVISSKAWRDITIEILAEPYAYGLQETAVNAQTVNNDPASGTNPVSFKITNGTIIGDVPAPATVTLAMGDATNIAGKSVPRMCSITPVGAGYTAIKVVQIGTSDGWTAGSGMAAATADAAYSGGSYRALTPPSTTLASIGTLADTSLPAEQGTYKVYLRMKRSDTSSTFAFRLGIASGTAGTDGPAFGPISYFLNGSGAANAAWVDLGTHQIVPAVPPDAGVTPKFSLNLYAAKVSGSGTANADCLLFVPIELAEGAGSTAIFAANPDLYGTLANVSTTATFTLRDDGKSWGVYGTSVYVNLAVSGAAPLFVYPGYVNYVHVLKVLSSSLDTQLIDVISTTTTLTIAYYPRYLYVRPSTT